MFRNNNYKYIKNKDLKREKINYQNKSRCKWLMRKQNYKHIKRIQIQLQCKIRFKQKIKMRKQKGNKIYHN